MKKVLLLMLCIFLFFSTISYSQDILNIDDKIKQQYETKVEQNKYYNDFISFIKPGWTSFKKWIKTISNNIYKKYDQTFK